MAHISTGHPEIAGYYYEILETIENPLCIYEGTGSMLYTYKKEKVSNIISRRTSLMNILHLIYGNCLSKKAAH